jgi:hypothetical protein
MKTKIHFSERQTQKQKWIWFVVWLIFLMSIFAIIQQVLLKNPIGNNPVPNWALFLIAGFSVLLVVFLYKNVLLTRITDQGIHYQFIPFHHKERIISWSQIKKAYVRVYDPIPEYGGWGLRTIDTKGNGIAINMMGKIGLQLELNDGKNILIGTQRGDEVKKVIESLSINTQNI